MKQALSLLSSVVASELMSNNLLLGSHVSQHKLLIGFALFRSAAKIFDLSKTKATNKLLLMAFVLSDGGALWTLVQFLTNGTYYFKL